MNILPLRHPAAHPDDQLTGQYAGVGDVGSGTVNYSSWDYRYDRPRDGFGDTDTGFLYAVSLLAALEVVANSAANASVLAYLGMARAELTDFGQRRTNRYIEVEVADSSAGLRQLEEQLTALLESSQVLQHTLRIEASRRLVRRAIETVP